MKLNKFPIFNIEQFGHGIHDPDFYANTISSHLRENQFIQTPHKHDFYLVVLFTRGTGTHQIDFKNYTVKPGSLFFLTPGQIHNWQLSPNIEGFIFFHSKSFYNIRLTAEKVENYSFFSSQYNSPVLRPGKEALKIFEHLFKEILSEYAGQRAMKLQKMHTLVTLFYIELSRAYIPNTKSPGYNPGYLVKLRKMEELVEQKFKSVKSLAEYAKLMFMSEKHLNRICKTCLNKTTTDLITGRIILEAKRMFVQSSWSVKEVSEELGYTDHSYFTRLFTKKTGLNPKTFMKTMRTGKEDGK